MPWPPQIIIYKNVYTYRAKNMYITLTKLQSIHGKIWDHKMGHGKYGTSKWGMEVHDSGNLRLQKNQNNMVSKYVTWEMGPGK